MNCFIAAYHGMKCKVYRHFLNRVHLKEIAHEISASRRTCPDQPESEAMHVPSDSGQGSTANTFKSQESRNGFAWSDFQHMKS